MDAILLRIVFVWMVNAVDCRSRAPLSRPAPADVLDDGGECFAKNIGDRSGHRQYPSQDPAPVPCSHPRSCQLLHRQTCVHPLYRHPREGGDPGFCPREDCRTRRLRAPMAVDLLMPDMAVPGKRSPFMPVEAYLDPRLRGDDGGGCCAKNIGGRSGHRQYPAQDPAPMPCSNPPLLSASAPANLCTSSIPSSPRRRGSRFLSA